jgi:hypothetical protein
MPDILTDGDFSTAANVSDIREYAPFSQYGINDLLVLEQDFVIARASYSTLAIDTTHPTIANYFLALETPYSAVAMKNTVQWTRRYAKVPSSFSRPGGTYPYTFPVLLTGDLTTSRLFAKPITVNARIQVDFFHTSDPNSIAIIDAQRYVLAFNPTIDATSPYGEPAVADASFSLALTVPSYTTYAAWIAGGIEIVPEASKITPNWMGNIHMRETIYLKAK